MHLPIKKRKTSVSRDAEDVDTGASGSMTAPTETNSIGSSSSPMETINSASSSVTASIGTCYEVFLSFRGPDTRYGFTDHLYNGLRNAGIDTFRDDDELSQGENIRPKLMEAITSSKILIPILSVTYGTSSWCLDELVQIMEHKDNNGQIVLPIFYKVKPADVRHQIGSFGDAFHERERRLQERPFNPTILEKWKKALDEVSALKGYEANGYEGELVKSIVQKVLSELKKEFKLVVPENLVGIDGHVEKVVKLLDNNSSATLFVGIHGMGGIGKTTLAKTVFNKLSDQFKYCSFIADVRESCRRNGLECLQKQLIFDIVQQNKKVSNKDDGTKFISSKFKDKKVFILLDDVDDKDQLKALVGNHNWFSSGSRILITTRNNSVLDNGGVDFEYEHEVMDKNDSMVLFSRHAFRRNSPPIEFEGLAHDVITTTGGLPLSIEVLGSFLCGKRPEFWRGTIDKLKIVPHKKVQEKLRISYEELDYGQKQIFLDIACFFIGTERRVISYMWDACGFFPEEGIEVLRFMSLIKIGDDNEFIMHDQLRDLGREIVREENQQEPQYRSRLWDSKEVLKVLEENTGTEKIGAINFPWFINTFERNDYIFRGLKKLTNLRFLRMPKVYLRGDFEDSTKELRWLECRDLSKILDLKNFHFKKLAVLKLQGYQINKWEGWSLFTAEKLKYLDLSFCESLENTDFLSVFKKLEVLILNNCCWGPNGIGASIGEMEALLRLELRNCKRLTELPEEIGNLKALQQLDLSHNESLALPESIGFLENLEFLDISSSGIEELPDIGKLRKLRELRASDCRNLKGIMAESMCDLSSLRHLDFFGCDKLQSLPDLPSGLIDLRVTCQSNQLPSLLPSTLLKNSECSQPMDVEGSESPQSLNTPCKLEILDVHNCGSIKVVDVSHFIHLRTLSITFCKNLLEVRGLDKSTNLESLAVTRCDSIKRLDLPKFRCLKKLDVYNCKNLAEIEGLDRLGYLESLDIGSCTLIRRLDLPKSGRLKELNSIFGNFAEIQGLDTLEFLESLDIFGCHSIGRLDLPKSGRLKKLRAASCENLAEIQGLDRSEFLKSLDISSCTSIGRLDLPKSGRLKMLDAGGCENLAKIQGLDKSEFLESLDIKWCTSIGRLDLPKSERLNKLLAVNCENLAEIQGLEFLKSLYISSCTSIGRLDLSKAERLEELDARYCENLAEIQGLDRSKFLERLDIFQCTSIRRLDLPKSGRLKILLVVGCKNLVEIQGLNRLEFLERLNISRCTSIGSLDLPKSGRLKILKAKDCTNLVEIQGLEFLKEVNIIGCKSLKTIPEQSRTRIYQYYEITNGETTGYRSDYTDDSDEPNEPNDSDDPNEPNDSDESIEWQ